jgi:hypothetical protein
VGRSPTIAATRKYEKQWRLQRANKEFNEFRSRLGLSLRENND